MSEELVLVERKGHYATLSLNRPNRRNALNPEMLEQLADVLDALRDEDVRCVLLRGVEEHAFSAGFDIGRIGQPGSRQHFSGDQPAEDPYRRPKEAINNFPYPVIAMIYGYCIGAGLEIAVNCDMRVAADNARLGITPAKLGIVYDHSAIRMFIDLVGPAFTKELFCTGRLMDAQRAQIMGLVHDVVPQADLKEYANTLAEELACNAPLSVKASKYIVNRLAQNVPLTTEEQTSFEEMKRMAAASEDVKEGRAAFRERRRPRFVGR